MCVYVKTGWSAACAAARRACWNLARFALDRSPWPFPRRSYRIRVLFSPDLNNARFGMKSATVNVFKYRIAAYVHKPPAAEPPFNALWCSRAAARASCTFRVYICEALREYTIFIVPVVQNVLITLLTHRGPRSTFAANHAARARPRSG